MKKVIALILAAITILAIAALSGCGNKNKPENTTPIQSNQTTTPTSPTQTDPITDPTQTTPNQTTASEPNIEPTTASEPTVTTEPTTAQTEPTTVQTEPTTESTQATTDPYIDHTHAWDEGTVTKKVSYTENGEITYRCIDCGATKTESVPMLKVTFELVEQTITKLNYTRLVFNINLADGNKEYYYLYFNNKVHYLIPEHISQDGEFFNKYTSIGSASAEYYVKGDDGKYYKYESSRDFMLPNQYNKSLMPTEKEVITEEKNYEGYVIISLYSSSGEDLNYQMKFDIIWIAKNSKDDFGYNFTTKI